MFLKMFYNPNPMNDPMFLSWAGTCSLFHKSAPATLNSLTLDLSPVHLDSSLYDRIRAAIEHVHYWSVLVYTRTTVRTTVS